MNENFVKYVLAFLAVIYLLSGIVEVFMTTNGADVVFQSVDKLVPHIGMFLLGFYFSKK